MSMCVYARLIVNQEVQSILNVQSVTIFVFIYKSSFFIEVESIIITQDVQVPFDRFVFKYISYFLFFLKCMVPKRKTYNWSVVAFNDVNNQRQTNSPRISPLFYLTERNSLKDDPISVVLWTYQQTILKHSSLYVRTNHDDITIFFLSITNWVE